MAGGISDSLGQFLSSPLQRRRLAIGAVLIVSVLVFGSLIFWNTTPEYQILFSNLSPEDAGEMINKLKEKKVPFQLAHQGTSILIPKEQVYDLRLSLAAEGLPKGGGVGFEVFDRTSLGTTDFVQKLNYQRALQGELSRTIRQIKEVEQARVHIVAPRESLFLEEQKKSTASVFIKTRSGLRLAPSQVEGIVHLVASAVEGLEPGSITVVDTAGKILSKRIDTGLPAQLTTHQLDYQRNVEEELKKKVQGMLEEFLGLNKAIARVSAEIDFQRVDIREEKFDPGTVVRSEQRNAERSSASPGTKQGEEGKAAAANSSERNYEVRNYEVSRINKHIQGPAGSVKKISAAVIVDGNYREAKDSGGKRTRQFLPRSPEEMKNLESIVKKAIGFDEKRGDQVEVITMPFSWSILEEEVKATPESLWKEYLLLAYKPLVTLLLALIFIFWVVRPLLRRKTFPRAEEPLLAEPRVPALTEAAPAPPVDLRAQTAQMVREDPSRTAGIVKAWLNERE